MEVSPGGSVGNGLVSGKLSLLSDVDQKKLQLLESRITRVVSATATTAVVGSERESVLPLSPAGSVPQTSAAAPPVLHSTDSNATHTNTNNSSTVEDIETDTSTSTPGNVNKLSFGASAVEAKEETSSESSSLGKENRKRSLDVIEIDDRSDSRTSQVEELSHQDTGSRGGPSAQQQQKNTIEKYFLNFSSSGQAGAMAGSSSSTTSASTLALAQSHSPPGAHYNRGGLSYGNNPNSSGNLHGGKNSKDPSAAQLAEYRRELESLRIAKELAESKVARLEDEVSKASEIKERNFNLSKCLEDIYRSNARQEMRRKRDRIALDSVRLGKFRTIPTGPASSMETWEEGYALKEITQRQMELLQFKEELDKRRKKLQSQKRIAKKEDGGGGDFDYDHDLATEAEALRAHGEQQKRDEQSLADERRLLESEKEVHKKELRRCECEDRSRFAKDLPCLNGRYILTSILGRGGFSEVWKAFDLVERRDVAIKIHQLNPAWMEERKQSYIKHVTREYTIHRDMQHPRIVQLYDVFEIDMNSFATVMELCRGTDLDEKLKKQRLVPEKDCRVIIMQILSGLKYLNTPNDGDSVTGEPRRKAIIHYDLKPANILFDECGDVKITDFGLSKIVEDTVIGTSIELTSQGSGTYWYLPPECSDHNPVISPKVDIWSIGVIFYQMLFGRRPYGEGKSQDQVLKEGIMRNPKQVEFPSASDPKVPKVSEEVKDFIRSCLTLDQHQRPDINALCMHPYLRTNKKFT